MSPFSGLPTTLDKIPNQDGSLLHLSSVNQIKFGSLSRQSSRGVEYETEQELPIADELALTVLTPKKFTSAYYIHPTL